MSSQHKDPSDKSDLGYALTERVSYVASNPILCNICCMARPQLKSSPLNELCSALPSLPMRLQEVGRFVAANDYDATTRSMRELAAVAGADPASFTRLAQALGYSGWDELRAALTEARRPAQPSPFSGRTRGRRQGPNSDVTLVTDKFEAEAAGLARISSGSVAKAAKTLHVAQRIWIAGFRSCRSVAELLNYQLRLFRPDEVQLVGGSGPEDLDLGAFHAGDAVVAIGFAPYSTASVLSARAAHRSRATLIAIADTAAAPMAEGAEHLLLFEAASSPGFFPSLTGAIAIAQSLAAVTFVLGGVSAKRRLEETEARLAETSQYVAERG
jgi:DNA-binding MurR/RpiR family transcriptional regulator